MEDVLVDPDVAGCDDTSCAVVEVVRLGDICGGDCCSCLLDDDDPEAKATLTVGEGDFVPPADLKPRPNK